MNKQLPFCKRQLVAGERPARVATCSLMAMVSPAKDLNPYEIIVMGPKERRRFLKEYDRINKKLLREILYDLIFIIWPWKQRRWRSSVYCWIQRGRHFEWLLQHRHRHRCRRQMHPSTPRENENSNNWFASLITNLRAFLRFFFLCYLTWNPRFCKTLLNETKYEYMYYSQRYTIPGIRIRVLRIRGRVVYPHLAIYSECTRSNISFGSETAVL